MRASIVLVVLIAGCTVASPRVPMPDGGVDAFHVDAFSLDAGNNDASTFDAPPPIDANDVDAPALACTGSMIMLPDPSAPDGDETQPPTCTGCPAFTNVTITTNGTTATINGTVSGSSSCTWTLVSPSCGGTTGALGDDEFGMFSRTLPLFCGQNRLQLVCDNANGRAIATRTIAGPSCGGRDVQVTLTWGATSNDQELHLIRAGGHINSSTDDCTWFTCVHVSPDWGVIGDPSDDPHKDVDWTGTFGPENIYLMHAPNGSYEVMVEYWGSGTQDSPSITVLLGGRTVWMGSHAMNLHDVWDVGRIDIPAATFTPVDTIIPCQSAWRTGGSYGCALPIP